MASLKRFELPTHGLEGRCSILLSYRLIAYADAALGDLRRERRAFVPSRTVMERVMGIGPTQSAWKADILPLNYTRTDSNRTLKEQSTIQCLTILSHWRFDVNEI